MTKKRKARVLVFEIRITVFTDFMQELFSGMIKMVVYALGEQEKEKGRLTKIEFNERVLDAKTFAPFKK